ncbi:hypothetical protein F4806DRAFT_467347 [Annulohypoxylon nitens]|nr:hypothetical protein F4806DRAFT_467347 [Annulohypoxylon nitens]
MLWYCVLSALVWVTIQETNLRLLFLMINTSFGRMESGNSSRKTSGGEVTDHLFPKLATLIFIRIPHSLFASPRR